MSALERNTSRKGRKQRPKVEAATILEALHDLGQPSTIMEIADKAGCSRNSAGDRLSDLWVEGLVSRTRMEPGRRYNAESLTGPARSNTGRLPLVFDVTREGRDRVAKMRHLASDVDLETQGERFDRAAQFLEAEAEAIEAKMAGTPNVDPRQVTIEQVLSRDFPFNPGQAPDVWGDTFENLGRKSSGGAA